MCITFFFPAKVFSVTVVGASEDGLKWTEISVTASLTGGYLSQGCSGIIVGALAEVLGLD